MRESECSSVFPVVWQFYSLAAVVGGGGRGEDRR